MEVNREEERRSRRVYYSDLLNCPCSAFHKAVQVLLRCFGLESSSSSSSSSQPLLEEEDLRTDETVEETGFMAMVRGLLRRRPRPSYSSGRPGQIN
ncbi:Elicitor peptide 6 [Cardamine amara subsp. amara]|uniref:Elicitor peptide 6 n=1 Tax=Cardamine amara subsp. amara TaxID=228776 RepID=A0ABD1ALK8_CARAN